MIVELLLLYVAVISFGYIVGVLAGIVRHRVYDPVFDDVVYLVAAVLTAGFTGVMLEYGALLYAAAGSIMLAGIVIDWVKIHRTNQTL